MLSLGGVNHLTHGGKKEGRVTCQALMDLSNGKAVEMSVDDGATVIVQAGRPPIVNGIVEERMRVGCGSATIGMFAKQWFGKVDEVVVVDDHITGVLSEHQAGKVLGVADTGIRMKASVDARPYFHVARNRAAAGAARMSKRSALTLSRASMRARARSRVCACSWCRPPANSMRFMFSTTNSARPARPSRRTARVCRAYQGELRAALCTVLFMGGAGDPARRALRKIPCVSPNR